MHRRTPLIKSLGHFFLSFAVIGMSLMCRNEKLPRPKYEYHSEFYSPRSFKGLAFTASDLFYQKSSAFFWDAESQKALRLLDAQSGDSILLSRPHGLFLMNRSPYLHNIVRFSQLDTSPFFAYERSVSAAFEYGDPSGLSLLPDGRLLLSYFAKGSLGILDPMTGAHSEVSGFKDQNAFRPGSQFMYQDGEHTVILFAHSAITVESSRGLTVADGTQAIYGIHQNRGGEWVPLNEGKALGHPHASHPVLLEDADGGLIVAGLCYAQTRDCHQGIERLNFESISAALLGSVVVNLLTDTLNLDQEPISLNGQLQLGLSSNSILANVVMTRALDDFQSGAKYLVEISFDQSTPKQLQKIYQYTDPKSSGAYLLMSHQSEKMIFFGDMSPEGGGFLYQFVPDRPLRRLKLDQIPYAGAFVH